MIRFLRWVRNIPIWLLDALGAPVPETCPSCERIHSTGGSIAVGVEDYCVIGIGGVCDYCLDHPETIDVDRYDLTYRFGDSDLDYRHTATERLKQYKKGEITYIELVEASDAPGMGA